MPTYHSASGSAAEDLFIELFSETFGAEKAGYLYSQYHFYDIYHNSRYVDFLLENGAHRVDVQMETIERYVREGKLVPDLVVPMSEHRTFKYFKEESLQKYAEQYGWTIIDDSNRKDMFMDMIRQMDMSYSYKPVLIKAILLYTDDKGRIKLDDIVAYFKSYYEGRRAAGLPAEKKNSIFAKGGYTDKEAERNILSNPFKRFEDMQMLRHTKTLGIVQVDEAVWKRLSKEEKAEMEEICDTKLRQYYERMTKQRLDRLIWSKEERVC